MGQTTGTSTRLSPTVTLEVYYDRATRSWWGFYADGEGTQLTPAWFGFTRDEVLIHRPDTPT
jgi:hypothetical protein